MAVNNLENEKIFLKDMFPFLSNEDIENIFISTKDLNIAITKVLDGSYKGINVNIKNLSLVNLKQKKINHDLYYPELFNNRGIDSCSGDISRYQSDFLYSKIQNIKNKLNLCKNKKVLEYQSDEINKLHDQLDKLNRKRAVMILNNSLQKPGTIDLHGLYTKEALMFISDFIKVYRPKKVNFITGCEGNSQSLRPSVINYLKEKGYSIQEDESPYIKGIKKNS